MQEGIKSKIDQDTLEFDQDLEELQAIVDRLSSASASPEDGEGSDDITDMISHGSSEDSSRLVRVASQHDVPVAQRHAELKAALQQARADLAAYERNVAQRDVLEHQLEALHFRDSCENFLKTVKAKDFSFPYSESSFFFLERALKLTSNEKENFSIICQETKLSNILSLKEKKERLSQLISLVEARLKGRQFPVESEGKLEGRLADCKSMLRGLSGSAAQVELHKKSLSLALLSDLSQSQYRLECLLKSYEELGLTAKFARLAAIVDQSQVVVHEWPNNEDGIQALLQKIVQDKAFLADVNNSVAMAKAMLIEIQSTLAVLTALEQEYMNCELDPVPAHDYQALYSRWRGAVGMPEQCTAAIDDVVQTTLPQLNQLIQRDESLVADCQSRHAFLQLFEQRVVDYIVKKQQRTLKSAVVRHFQSDCEQRIPYMKDLLESLRNFALGREDIGGIRATILEVLNDPKKFLTNKEGEEKKKTLRGILEDLIAQIRLEYPEELTVESFVNIVSSDDEDQLGNDFNAKL